jgi:hypothetical protein
LPCSKKEKENYAFFLQIRVFLKHWKGRELQQVKKEKNEKRKK